MAMLKRYGQENYDVYTVLSNLSLASVENDRQFGLHRIAVEILVMSAKRPIRVGDAANCVECLVCMFTAPNGGRNDSLTR